MKNDLATSILAGLIGTIVAFFACNAILSEPAKIEIKTITSNSTYDLNEPNPEIFNFRAINPTVEVYVGQCQEYDANGECVKTVEGDPNTPNDTNTSIDDDAPSEETPSENSPSGEIQPEDSEEPDNETNAENIDGPTD